MKWSTKSKVAAGIYCFTAMSGRTTVSAPFAVGGNLAEGVEDVDQRQRARQAQRSDGRAKSLSDALLNDSAVIKARFPDRQDAKKVYTTSMSEMSKAIPKNVEISLYDTDQDLSLIHI